MLSQFDFLWIIFCFKPKFFEFPFLKIKKTFTLLPSKPNHDQPPSPPQIITTPDDSEPSSDTNHDETPSTAVVVDELSNEMQSLDVKLSDSEPPSPSPSVSPSEHVRFVEDEDQLDSDNRVYQHDQKYYNHADHQQPHDPRNYLRDQHSPFHYNKRQTGKKNLSNIIVGDDNNIEFDQIEDKGFGVVKINRPIGVPASRTLEQLNDNESVHSRDSRDSHTADGFFDLKFYSHPLW